MVAIHFSSVMYVHEQRKQLFYIFLPFDFFPLNRFLFTPLLVALLLVLVIPSHKLCRNLIVHEHKKTFFFLEKFSLELCGMNS